MKKMLFIFLCFFSLYSVSGWAFVPKRHLTLKVQYSDAKSNANDPLNINKTIKIDPCSKDNHVVMTRVKLVKNLPVTEVVLVKVENVSKKQAHFKFSLLTYGFKQNSNVIGEPQFYIKNGESGQVSTDKFVLKFNGKWG